MDAGPDGDAGGRGGALPGVRRDLRSVDDGAARAVPGVREVVRIEQGVAVVAKDYCLGRPAATRSQIQWDEGALATLDDAGVSRGSRAWAEEPGKVARSNGLGGDSPASAARRPGGGVRGALPRPRHHGADELHRRRAGRRGDALGSYPVFRPARGCWAAAPAVRRPGLTGVPVSRVTVHTTHLGGGFGRRSETDFVSEACQVSKAVGAPVKLIWSREDDIRHDQYRPAARHQLRAGLAADGSPVGGAIT